MVHQVQKVVELTRAQQGIDLQVPRAVDPVERRERMVRILDGTPEQREGAVTQRPSDPRSFQGEEQRRLNGDRHRHFEAERRGGHIIEAAGVGLGAGLARDVVVESQDAAQRKNVGDEKIDDAESWNHQPI